VTVRRLTIEQQAYVEKAMPIIEVVIWKYLQRNADLMDVARRCDLHSAAQQAACQAALTYDPAKAGISAYFSVAIHRAISKEVLARQRHERRMRVAMPSNSPDTSLHYERMKARALKALQFLPPYEKRLLEDHLIEGVTLERLGREQRLDKRTVRKRIKKAIEFLREAEKDLP